VQEISITFLPFWPDLGQKKFIVFVYYTGVLLEKQYHLHGNFQRNIFFITGFKSGGC
jgi:hypothetical protein